MASLLPTPPQNNENLPPHPPVEEVEEDATPAVVLAHTSGETDILDQQLACLEGSLRTAAALDPEALSLATALAEKGDTAASADTPWVSGDILALMVTALLGIGTFALQARSAKQSDANQRQIELSSQEHEAARATAERQLARVREQMALYASPMVASCVRRISLL